MKRINNTENQMPVSKRGGKCTFNFSSTAELVKMLDQDSVFANSTDPLADYPLKPSFLLDALRSGVTEKQIAAIKLLSDCRFVRRYPNITGDFGEVLIKTGDQMSENVLWEAALCLQSLCEHGHLKSSHKNLDLLCHLHELTLSPEIRHHCKLLILNLFDWDIHDTRLPYHSGNNAYEMGNYEEAIIYYSCDLIFNPDHGESYFNRGLCLYNLCRFDESVSDYSKALELDPVNPVIFNNLGDAYYRKQQFNDAIFYYERAIGLNNQYLKAHYNLGLAYACLNDYEKAAEEFTEVIKLNSEFADAFHVRGLAYDYLNDNEKARADYERAIELSDGDFPEAQRHLENLNKKAPLAKSYEEEYLNPDKMIEFPRYDFSQVIGMTSVKDILNTKLIYPNKYPDLADQFGISRNNGLLIYGPPGCGKTYIVRAAAKEAGATFFYVDLTIVNMYIGNTEYTIRALFRKARKMAPSIIFIDELDGIGVKRDDSASIQSYERKIVNQFLIELSRLEEENSSGILIIGASNMPWLIDKALLRAGRISEQILVSGPDHETRADLFRHYLSGRPVERMNLKMLAAETENYSSAQIRKICSDASEKLLLEAVRDSRIRKITMNDLLGIISNLRPGIIDWFEEAKRNHYC